MLAPELAPAAIAILATLCAICVVVTLFYSYIAKQSEAHKRFTAISTLNPGHASSSGFEEIKRRKAIDVTLRELDERKKIRHGNKPSLTARLRQAGLFWSTRTYIAVSIGSAFASFIVAIVGLGLPALIALGFAISGGLLLPHFYVNAKRSHRLKTFSSEFPNAVDVIVRGVKAGLPLVDCLRIISIESQEPVRGEFKTILEDQTLGVPMDQAVQRLPERIPLPEANFFAIVIALQSRTGGGLSEALGNLSKVLRERKKMRAKIKAVSSEAKASAGIIGCLPIVVAFLIYLTSPAYLNLLFSTTTGNVVLAGSAFWMLIGVLVMRKMINFDF